MNISSSDKFVPQRETPEIKIALTKKQRVMTLITCSSIALLGSWLVYSIVADPSYWQLVHTFNTMCSFPPDSMRAELYWHDMQLMMGIFSCGSGIILGISAVIGTVRVKLNIALVFMIVATSMILLTVFPFVMGGC